MKNRVKISIDGKSFTLVGEESEEHIRSVAAYIDEKMTEVREKAVAVTLDSSLAYVLTSVNVADDYFKEKAYTAELEGRLIGMTARVQELTHKLEEAEKARGNAENKLDEYILAMEDNGSAQMHQTYHSAGKNKKGKNILFLCVLLVMMIPTEVILLPLYRLIVKMDLINNMWGIILPYLVVPMLVFFFRQYLMGIPKDFLDAARVDGCTEYGIFFKIMIPLMKPSFAIRKQL